MPVKYNILIYMPNILVQQHTCFRPYLSLRFPQKVELNIIPRNTTVVVRAC